jgi:hypothetical protein
MHYAFNLVKSASALAANESLPFTSYSCPARRPNTMQDVGAKAMALMRKGHHRFPYLLAWQLRRGPL